MCLELANITKIYGQKIVLDDINLKLGYGIYGFLGANGVGKTTLFGVISGYLTNYTGNVIYPNRLNEEVLIGFLPQNFTGYPDMTINQILMYLGTVKSNVSVKKLKNSIDEKLELFNLKDLKNKKLKTLSGGQLRRVGLAQAFLLNPKIVLLDEPTTGLDPTERIKFKNYISKLGHEQIILISTHIVSDLEFITKEIFILKDGHFVMSGSEKKLIESCNGSVWEMEFKDEVELQHNLKNYTISMIYEDEGVTKARVISSTMTNQSAVCVKPTLNDVYLKNFREEVKVNVK